jgi:hypothetical protein
MPFCTNKQWDFRGGKTKIIERRESAPTMVIDGCFGIELKKQWIDGDRNDVVSTPNGARFVIDDDTLLTWEHTNNVANDIYVDFPDEFGGSKETIQLDKAPLIARWRYRLYYSVDSNLGFAFQPELTQDQIDRGHTRPDWCVGSYAIFDKHHRKVGHIPRPYAITALGEKVWFDISINDNPPFFADITITGDTDWLKSLPVSAFPVLIDPTMGYTSIGGSWGGSAANFIFAHPTYTPEFDGEATASTVYNRYVSNQTYGLYNTNAGVRGTAKNPLGVGAGISATASAWNTDTYSSPASITAGPNYRLVVANESATATAYDVEVVDPYHNDYYQGRTYTHGVLPDPYPASTPENGLAWSDYTTYEAPASPIIQVFIRQKKSIYRR